MSLHIAAKEIDAKYYPDVANVGDLQTAISKSLADNGSQLIAASTSKNFIPYNTFAKIW